MRKGLLFLLILVPLMIGVHSAQAQDWEVIVRNNDDGSLWRITTDRAERFPMPDCFDPSLTTQTGSWSTMRLSADQRFLVTILRDDNTNLQQRLQGIDRQTGLHPSFSNAGDQPIMMDGRLPMIREPGGTCGKILVQ